MRNSLVVFLLALAAALGSPGWLAAQPDLEFGSPAGPVADYSTATESSGAGSAEGVAEPTLESLENEPSPAADMVDSLTSDDPLDDRQMDDRQVGGSEEATGAVTLSGSDDRLAADDGEPVGTGGPLPDDEHLQDDRRQTDAELSDDFESADSAGTTTVGAVRPRRLARRSDTVRYRVVPRLLPLEGLPGSLYRWSVVDAVPVTGSPDLVEVVELLSCNVSRWNLEGPSGGAGAAQAIFDAATATADSTAASAAATVFDPFPAAAEEPAPGAASADATTGAAPEAQPAGAAAASPSRVALVSGESVLLYTTARAKVRGKLKLSGPTEFDVTAEPLVNTWLGTLQPLTPRGLRLPVDSLERIGEGEDEPADRRFESADVQIRFARAAGSDASPSLGELSPDDQSLATLHVLDYESGLADEMAHYAALKPGEALHVFVNDDGGVSGAYESRWLPVPGRSNLDYRSVDLRLMGGGATTLVEPCPVIVFSTSYVENQIPQTVLSTLKHELGHVLHELKAPTRHRGYGNSFWQHTYAVRSNDQAAFVEGFAEYTAFRFADDKYEANPTDSLRDLQLRHNVRAYEDLTFFYWHNFRNRSSVKSRLSDAELLALQLEVFDYQGQPGSARPSPEQFQARLVQEATGKGQPPFTAEELNFELASLNASNPSGLKNWTSEHVSPETQRQLNEANEDLLRAVHPLLGPSKATIEENLAVISKLSMRSPEDLMMNEGTVAALLLELDRELSAQGLDFYGKVLAALDKDPYASGAGSTTFSTQPSEVTTGFDPLQRPVPTNFKELIALLDRDPELTGKLLPVIEKASSGVLTAKHFVLAPRRDLDPLTRMDPGDEMAAASSSGGASGSSSGEPAPRGDGGSSGDPVPPDGFVGPDDPSASDDRAIPDEAPEAQPDFEDLRGR